MTGAVDIRPELVEQILDVLTKRDGDGQVGMIEVSAATDALLKVVAFLVAMGPQMRTRAERRAFVDTVGKYLNREIVAFQEGKTAGHFDYVTVLPTAGLH